MPIISGDQNNQGQWTITVAGQSGPGKTTTEDLDRDGRTLHEFLHTRVPSRTVDRLTSRLVKERLRYERLDSTAPAAKRELWDAIERWADSFPKPARDE